MTEYKQGNRDLANELLCDIEYYVKLCPECISTWEYAFVTRTRLYWNKGNDMSEKQIEKLFSIQMKVL